MSKSTRKQKKSKQSGKKAEEKSKSDYFSWTDDEFELLLKVAIDYKTTKTMENIDWESCHSPFDKSAEHTVFRLLCRAVA